MTSYAELALRIESVGMTARGGFHPQPQDALPNIGTHPVRTLILIGLTSAEHWNAFAGSPECQDGRADPLDRWSTRMLDALADELGGRALYPFDGPPWWPFQRWARRALALHVSPLGLLIDPKSGLWHSYRGALALTIEVPLPAPQPWPDPCAGCEARPCLHTCPVEAVRSDTYLVDVCRRYVQSSTSPCRSLGCLARRACPIGAEQVQSPAQAAFHMRAFAHDRQPAPSRD